MFRVLRKRHPEIEPETFLKYTIKGLNDTMRPNGLVSSLLVFGTVSTFPIENKIVPAQGERMRALRTAREEITRISAEQGIVTVLKTNVPLPA